MFNVVLKNFDILGQVNLPELQSGDELTVSKYIKYTVNCGLISRVLFCSTAGFVCMVC